MLIARNKFLVEVDNQFSNPKIKGLEFIDTDYNPKALATKTGRIHSLPIAISSDFKYDIKLNVGDGVVFNHIVCQDRNKYSDKLFFCNYHNIFAKIENEILIPLEDAIFCEKIIEPDFVVGCFVAKGKVSSKYAKVFELSSFAEKQGMQKGDIVFFTKNADYEIIIGGKELFKMHLRNIIGIERDGVLKTFRNKLLVKDITELGNIGGIKKIYTNTSLRTGVVIESGNTGIPENSVLTYFNGSATSMNWKGEEYAFVGIENLKYIKK